MSYPKEWDEDEDNFDLTLSQRTEELYRIPNREPDEEGMVEAAVLPLRDLVIFPRMVSPIFVGREGSLLAVQEAQLKEQTVIGLTQHDADLDTSGSGRFPAGRGGDGGRAPAANAGRFPLCTGTRAPPLGNRGIYPDETIPDGSRPCQYLKCRPLIAKLKPRCAPSWTYSSAASSWTDRSLRKRICSP